MKDEIIICIPGNWKDRARFVESVVTATDGEFIFAGLLLAHPEGNDHVELEFYEAEDPLKRMFYYAGQGSFSETTLDQIEAYRSLVCLNFPFDLISQKERIIKFTEVIQKSGGIAVKLETSGIAHEWERWFELLRSDNPFDTYCAGVLLVGDENFYYSCGMHNFGLPDTQVSNQIESTAAAELINHFNFWQIMDRPSLKSGETFSLTENSPYFRLEMSNDTRHTETELFHNPHGLWELRPI